MSNQLNSPSDGAVQAFIKFFGASRDRSTRSTSVAEEVMRTGCYKVCSYPRGKRPRNVQDQAVIFMATLVTAPADILIYGRAIATHHEPGRDDATQGDIAQRPGWQAQWPHFVRVHHPEFLNGSLADGVSLNAVMTQLEADSFATTQANARAGKGNVDPRKAYMRQAAVRLSSEGLALVNELLDAQFQSFGKLANEWSDESMPDHVRLAVAG